MIIKRIINVKLCNLKVFSFINEGFAVNSQSFARRYHWAGEIESGRFANGDDNKNLKKTFSLGWTTETKNFSLANQAD